MGWIGGGESRSKSAPLPPPPNFVASVAVYVGTPVPLPPNFVASVAVYAGTPSPHFVDEMLDNSLYIILKDDLYSVCHPRPWPLYGNVVSARAIDKLESWACVQLHILEPPSVLRVHAFAIPVDLRFPTRRYV